MNEEFEEVEEVDEYPECNNCGDIMYLLPDKSIFVCTNPECTSCYEEYDE